MYTGHFAISLVLCALYPSVSPYALLLGAGWLDVLDGIFVVRPFHLGSSPFSAIYSRLKHIVLRPGPCRDKLPAMTWSSLTRLQSLL